MFRASFLASVFFVATSAPVFAQTVLDKGTTFDDPRMSEIRASFSENFGDIRDLSFQIKATLWPHNRGSFNITAGFHDNAVLTQFVSKLGGRVKGNNSEFILIFDLYAASRDCKESKRCSNSFNVRIIDRRDNSILKNHGGSFSCPPSEVNLHNSRYLVCPSDNQLFEEILLNL